MLNKLFPKIVDSHYTGHPLAKWMLVIITIVSIVRSLIHIFFADGGAQTIATIPLNTFSANAAAAVILIMALWGSSQLLMAFLYFIVLLRYQTLIPLMYLFLLIEYALRIFLMHIKPVVITGTAPGHVFDFIMVPLVLVMLGLSLINKKGVSNKETGAE